MEEKCFQAEESGYDPLLGLTGFHRPVRSRSLGQGRVAHTFKKAHGRDSADIRFSFCKGKD
jgi:hypothetical protein